MKKVYYVVLLGTRYMCIGVDTAAFWLSKQAATASAALNRRALAVKEELDGV